MVSVAPAVSVTFTVKVQVPAAVGVPLRATVPLMFGVSAAAVSPVPPATKELIFTVVYGVVPPLTVMV